MVRMGNKTPVLWHAYGLIWTWLERGLVEAAEIEPLDTESRRYNYRIYGHRLDNRQQSS
jgi:hypothetical protein